MDFISMLFEQIPNADFHSEKTFFRTQNFYTLSFLQYHPEDVHFIENVLKHLNFHPQSKNKNEIVLPEEEFLSIKKAIYNLSLYQLINDANNWENDGNRMIFSSPSFSDTQIIADYFGNNRIPVYLANNQFSVSKSDFVKLKRLNRGFHPSPKLKGDKSIYNPLSEEEWQDYKELSSIFIHFQNPSQFPLRENDFWKDMKEQTMEHPYDNLILRNNITVSEQEKEMLLQLSLFPMDEFKEMHKNCGAIYKNRDDLIVMSGDTYSQPFLFFSSFFHELNHRVQAFSKCIGDYTLLSQLVIEADSKAISILNAPQIYTAYNGLYDMIKHNIVTNMKEDTYKHNLIPEQTLEEKIISLNWAVHSSAEEQYHQFLFDLLLQKDRESTYRFLAENNIKLSANQFQNICKSIESWRSFYYEYHKGIEKLSSDTSVNRNTFNNLFKLNVSTMPQAIIAEENLKEFGYAAPLSSSKNEPYIIQYNGLSPEFMKKFQNAIQKKDVLSTIKLFETLKKSNSFLKPVSTQYNNRLLYQIEKAVQAMAEGKKPTEVLYCFNYNLQKAPPIFVYPKTNQH